MVQATGSIVPRVARGAEIRMARGQQGRVLTLRASTALASALAVVAIGSALGLVQLAAWIDYGGSADWLGNDAARWIEASSRLGGDIYANPDYLWTPLAAVLGWPATVLPLGLAFGLAKLAGIGAFAAYVASDHPPLARAAIVVGSTLCSAVAQDVIKGNVNVPLTLAVALAIWSNRPIAALPLGVLIAAFPKPLIVPLVFWMIRWRPLAATWAAVGALAATGVEYVIAGGDAYRQWPAILVDGLRFAGPIDWNLALSRIVPDLTVPIAIIGLVTLVAGLVVAGPRNGFRLAVVMTLVVSPYLGVAMLAPLLLAAWAAIRPPEADAMPSLFGQRFALRRTTGPRPLQ